MCGTGQISSSSQYVGRQGTGTFNHSAGTNTISCNLHLGYNAGSRGYYELRDVGQLTAYAEYVGNSGTGTFSHTAGTNTVSNNLYLGFNSGANGTYDLTGTGQLSAKCEYIGYSNSAAALFLQSGGTNTATFLLIGATGQYRLSGGVLQINGGLENLSTLDFEGGSATLNASSSIINFARPGSILKNAHLASLAIGPNSLLIVPNGFNPLETFAHYSNQGLLHAAGTTLTVNTGQTVWGWGTIDDLVICQGTIGATAGGSINLNNGISISDSGSADLGRGYLQIDDTVSGISGGTLSLAYQYTGNMMQVHLAIQRVYIQFPIAFILDIRRELRAHITSTVQVS